MAAWSRLQALSCAHAAEIGPQHNFGTWGRQRRSITVPDVIKENVEILGTGDEEQIKARVFWYLTYKPELFEKVLCWRN